MQMLKLFATSEFRLPEIEWVYTQILTETQAVQK